MEERRDMRNSVQTAPGSSTGEGPQLLDDLVLQYLDRIEAGGLPEDVLAELCQDHPREASALERGVSLLREVRLHPGPTGDGLPDRVGGFRLLKRLGSGGMGVVYLAEQETPRRRVALKLVRPDQLWFDGYRERFTREIESAGRLSHSSIAPVYEMGEHDGVPWFSQEYVIGASLTELLAHIPVLSPETLSGADLENAMRSVLGDELPESAWDAEFFRGSWAEVCSRIVRQVADALQHAHARGVLHRDVKPSNILLTPAGRAVLIDFGLASLQGTERLTRTGAQVGSLHYMPPEQLDARAREIGPWSDVYSLGVTLYELLTLRAPYASRSVQRLRGLILEGRAPAARRWNPAIARDVNVVVQCAMDPIAGLRYRSAADFGNDIAAAIAHRPIAARPPGPVARLSRWTRRHPAVALSVLASVFLFVVAPIGFGLQNLKAAESQRELNDELNLAIVERDELVTATLDAFNDVVRWTAHEAMVNLPGFQEARLQAIDEGLEIFERVVEARPDDLAVQREAALMKRTRGNILTVLGRDAEAHQEFEAAARVLERAAEQDGAGATWLRQLASLRYQQALIAAGQGLSDEELAWRREALELGREALAKDPEDLRNLRDVGTYASALATTIYGRNESPPELLELMSEAIAATRKAHESSPQDPRCGRALYEALGTRGEWYKSQGKANAALTDLEEAQAALDSAQALEPSDRVMRFQQIQSLGRLARLRLDTTEDAHAALDELERALELATRLVEDYPNIPRYERERLVVLESLPEVYRALDDFAKAREIHAEVSKAMLARAEENPDDFKAAIDAAVVVHNQTNDWFFDESLGEERFERVLELCDQAEELAEEYTRANPNDAYECRFRMLQHYKRGAVFNQLELVDELRAEADGLRDMQFEVPVKYLLTAKLYLHWANRSGEESGRRMALALLEKAVSLGLEDASAWDQAEIELELSDYSRARELGDIVRSRAGSR